MIKCMIVGAGGAIGAIGRYLMGLLPMNPENGFPLKTFLINVIGCFIIGIIAALADKNAVNPGSADQGRNLWRLYYFFFICA